MEITDEIAQKHTNQLASIYSQEQMCSQFCLSEHLLNYINCTAAALACTTMGTEKAGKDRHNQCN